MSLTVETTLGALPKEKLGRINAHEHIFVDSSQGVVKDPDFRLDNPEYAIADVTEWREAGGGAMVDTMPVSAGRNVGKLITVSQATGVPFIVPTGFHKSYYYWPDHWRFRYSEDEMTELIAAEVEEGCDLNEYQGPLVRRTRVRAGAMKVAGQYNFVDANMQKLIRVVGRVHQRNGCPVFVHTERGFECFELVQRLNDAGVPSPHVLVCHMDRNADLWLHRRLAETGVYLEYDTPSRFKYQPESVVVKLMREMIDAGYLDRLMLGGDLARRSYLKAYGGGPGYAYLLQHFTPRLRSEGFSERELDAIWRDNPFRWLTSGRA
jgi:5-phospho-D-xylono-1,4-lactonase